MEMLIGMEYGVMHVLVLSNENYSSFFDFMRKICPFSAIESYILQS